MERLAAEADRVTAVARSSGTYLLNEQMSVYDEAHNIATEAWASIVQGGAGPGRTA